jgi:hypothetical protein
MLLSACGSSDSAEAQASAPGEASAASEPAPPSPDAQAPAGDDGGLSDSDNGTGTVTLDGVVYPDFVGECLISRGLDPETYEPVPVGDLSDPGLILVVAVDNVASNPEVEANFVTTTEKTFRMTGIGGPGEMDSIAYVGPRTTVGSLDLAQVAFSGTTEDGVPVVAEVVCEIGLG